MGVESGMFGNAMVSANGTSGWARVIELVSWTCDRSVVESAYASNMTRGQRRRVTGTSDATGSFNCLFNQSTTPETQLAPGMRVKLRLYRSATEGHELWVKILSGPNQTVNVGEGTHIESAYTWGQDDDLPLWSGTLAAIPALT